MYTFTYLIHHCVAFCERNCSIPVVNMANNPEDWNEAARWDLENVWLRSSPFDHCRNDVGFPVAAQLEDLWKALVSGPSGLALCWFRSRRARLEFDLVLIAVSVCKVLLELSQLTLLDTRTPPFSGLAFFASSSSPIVSSRSDMAPCSWRQSSLVSEILIPLERADVREKTEEGGRRTVEECDLLVVSEGVELEPPLGGSSMRVFDQMLILSRTPPASRLR